MDPLTGGIVAGLIANGITEVACHMMPGSAAQLKQQRAIAEILKQDPSLTEILQKAVVGVARSAHFQDEKQTDRLRMFFCRPKRKQLYGRCAASTFRLQHGKNRSQRSGKSSRFPSHCT